MWMCLNDSFLSIVKDKNSDKLLVRSRRKGDIPKLFPKAEVIVNAGTDYKYRAFVSREEVAKALVDRVMNINYDNFKSSVRNIDLHNAYMKVWGIMHHVQE